MKAKLGYVTKHYPANIARYEQQEIVLGDRNNYCKTGPEATPPAARLYEVEGRPYAQQAIETGL